MSSRSVVSVGLFGRLSILAAPRRNVYETIQSIAEDLEGHAWREAGKPSEFQNSPSPATILTQALPTMLMELSALVDAIVLSDELLLFCGYDSKYFNELTNDRKGLSPRSTHPFAFYFTQLWPDEANRLREISEGLPQTLVSNNNRRLLDAEVVLDFPDRALTASSILDALEADGVDYHYMMEMYPWDSAGEEQEQAAYRRILEYVDTYLGEDWQEYRRTVRPTIHWPSALSRLGSALFDLPERREVQFQLGLFCELEIALQQATLGVSSLPAGGYYPLLAKQPHVLRSSLRQIASQAYQKRLLDDLERFGVACLDLEIPPFLRSCLHGAKDLFEVLENAVRLHKDRRIVDLRRHLQEVAHTTNPVKLRRYLLRLEGYIQASLDGIAGLAPVGLGISTNGERLSLSLSSSLISATRLLLGWRNPVVMMHTKLQRVLAEADSVGDLARVLQVPRAVAAKAIRDAKKLQAPTTE